MTTTTKSISRKYRKALRRAGIKLAFLKGAFHVTHNKTGLVAPQDIEQGMTLNQVAGPRPENPPYVEPFTLPVEESKPVKDIPALDLPTFYKKNVREGADGKKRTDYRVVKNPKAGERYYIKDTVKGRGYVEVDCSKLVAAALERIAC